jgi:hypothetical protein
MCLNKTYSKVHKGKHLLDGFPTQNGLKQEHALSPSLLNSALEYAIMKVQENQEQLELNAAHISYWSILMMLIYWVKI